MKILKNIAIILGALFLCIILVSFFLPSEVKVIAEREISCSNKAIYPQLADLKNWGKWNPWTEESADIKITYSEVSNEIGSSATYEDEGEDKVKITLTMLDYPNTVAYDVRFGDEDSMMDGVFALDNNSNKVTWTIFIRSGWNPVMKYMLLFFSQGIKGDLDKGLKNLSDTCNS